MAFNTRLLTSLLMLCIILFDLFLSTEALVEKRKFSKTGPKKFKARKFELLKKWHENSLNNDYFKNYQDLRVEKFEWSSCAGPDAALNLRKLELSDPIVIPGNLTVSVDADLGLDVLPPLKVAVEVKKKLGFLWVEVPCVENIGSCNYDDFCGVIPFKPDQPCPDFFVHTGLPCHCPATKGKYAVENGVLEIPKDPLPEFLARGQYSVRVSVSSRGQEITCLKIVMALA